jgi:ankyrin repeat protein
VKDLHKFRRASRGPVLVLITLLLNSMFLRAGEIHDAAAAGDLAKVEALLAADPALLESADNEGRTPLIVACAPRTRQVAVAGFLLDRGANPNARDKGGMVPLHYASRGDRGPELGIMERLVAKGADVNAQLDRGMVALHWVATSDDLRAARLLIDHGADLNARDKVGYGTVLHMAISNGRSEAMATLLVERGSKLNQVLSFENTELHLAALRGYADLTRALVAHGADVNAVNEGGRTALFYAARHGYRRLAEVLIAAGAKEGAIVEANYGPAPQLGAALGEGEAYLWYLGGLIGGGYAVKTKGHLLVFDPTVIDDSAEATLANGRLNPAELAGQKITVLVTKPAGLVDPSKLFQLAERIPGVEFVTGFKPEAPAGGARDLPPCRLAAPNTSFAVAGMQVHAIPSAGRVFNGSEAGGLGYLVEVDGLKIFHAGFHSTGNNAAQVERFRREIDFLQPFGPIDIAILPVLGHVAAAYPPYLYLLDRLSPKAVHLMGSDLTAEYPKCANALRARPVQVLYPEGGRSLGERFHYVRGHTPPMSVAPVPATRPEASK